MPRLAIGAASRSSADRRYPICYDWKCQPVSLCLDCFKHPDADSYDPATINANALAETVEFRRFLIEKGLTPPLDLKAQRRLPPIAPRKEATCPGCGEPMMVSPGLRLHVLLNALLPAELPQEPARYRERDPMERWGEPSMRIMQKVFQG
jgi:hypothetical protein